MLEAYWPLLLFPAAMMVLRFVTRRYAFSALVTLACLLIALFTRTPMSGVIALGYAFSIAGDYLLAHQKEKPMRFIAGVGGFFLAHACFLIYALHAAHLGILSAAAAVVLVSGYAIFLWRGIYPHAKGVPMRAALAMYMLISAAVLSVSLGTELALFKLGIFMIVFSDTLIGLHTFMGIRRVQKWILPTYYLCHILIAATLISRM